MVEGYRLELVPPSRRVSTSILSVSVLFFIACGAVLGAVRIGPVWFSDDGATWLGAVVGAAAAAALAVVAWPRFRPPSRLEPLVIGGRRVFVPRSVYREGVLQLDVRDVLHLGVATGPFGYLEILTDRRRHRIPLSCVQDRSRLRELDAAFVRALRDVPGGHEHLAEMEMRHRLGAELSRRRPEATLVLAALIVVVTLVHLGLAGFAPNPYTQTSVALRLGANTPALLRAEPWRLVSSTFVHAGLVHAYLNLLALLFLGTVLERLLGPARFVFVFLGAALAGAVTSAFAASAPVSLGASAGVLGALGALATLHLALREQLPVGFRQPLAWWALVLALEILLPAFVPSLDLWGHLGGLAAGLVLGVAVVLTPGFAFGAPAGRPVRAMAGVAVAVFLVGSAFAAGSALRPESGHEAELEQVLLIGDGDDVVGRAGVILSDPDAPTHLQQAADVWLSTESTKEDADPSVLLLRSERLETAGNLEFAVQLRWRALARDGIGAFDALVEGLAALSTRPFDVRGRAPPDLQLRRLTGDDQLSAVIEPPLRGAPVVLFLLHHGATGQVEGLFEWPLRPTPSGLETVRASIPADLRESLDAGGKLEAALWAMPPLTQKPTLHVYGGRHQWRRLPP